MIQRGGYREGYDAERGYREGYDTERGYREGYDAERVGDIGRNKVQSGWGI